MTDTPSAYPLAWPAQGWTRHSPSARRYGQFRHQGKHITIEVARRRLADELAMMGARQITLSTNIELRADGHPRSDRRAPTDPGVAVYFRVAQQPIVLACDRYDSVAANIAALAAVIEAKRAILRHGVVSAEQEFRGYAALPAPETWREVLGVPPNATLAQAEAQWKALAKLAHPDVLTGSHDAITRLNSAIAAARKELGNG